MQIAAALTRDGYVQFDSSPHASTVSVAQQIGTPENLSGFRLVQILTPKPSSDAAPNTYTGIYRTSAFPHHTDLAHWSIPPRFILLRCRQPSPAVQTTVLQFHDVLEDESESTLAQAHFRQRRKLAGRFSILKLRQGAIHRWDESFLVPDNEAGAALFGRVRERLSRANPTRVPLHSPGTCLLIDNWRMLHGREPVPLTEANRCLERIYLKAINV